MTDDWKEPADDDGVTLGPEEALAREITRSKSLKVERLQLRDRVEKLESEVARLARENAALQQNRPASPHGEALDNLENASSYPPHPEPRTLPTGWAFFLLLFNLLAVGVLLMVLLQRS